MFKIQKTPKTPNMIWDEENKKPLCKFVKGQLETNDEVLAKRLKDMGYEVSGEPEPPEKKTRGKPGRKKGETT